MTDKEILAELKKSYEYLYDIRENGCSDHCCGQLENASDRLDSMLNNLSNLYKDFFKTLELKDLIVFDHNFDNPIVIGSVIEADYEVYKKDDLTVGKSIGFVTCEDLAYRWYDDEKFLNDTKIEELDI